jgi:hypothetical protein
LLHLKRFFVFECQLKFAYLIPQQALRQKFHLLQAIDIQRQKIFLNEASVDEEIKIPVYNLKGEPLQNI